MASQESAQPLAALEFRLRRLEHYLTGDSIRPASGAPQTPKDKAQSIQARLERLERGVDELATRSVPVKELLYLHSKHPDLFQPATTTSTTLSPTEQFAIVNASAPSFSETSSRLSMLKDTPIPPTSASMQLIALRLRIEKAKRVQREQGEEIRELRARSAVLIEKWYELNVLGMGECWADWESRLEEAEKRVRRKERERREEAAEGEAY